MTIEIIAWIIAAIFIGGPVLIFIAFVLSKVVTYGVLRGRQLFERDNPKPKNDSQIAPNPKGN